MPLIGTFLNESKALKNGDLLGLRASVPTEDKQGELGGRVCISELSGRGEESLTLRNKTMRSMPTEAPRKDPEQTLGTTHSCKSCQTPYRPAQAGLVACFAFCFREVDRNREVYCRLVLGG